MANDVFANGREISCKAADGKSICAFPDVCLTPPTPPAGFIPVPYPNTGFATDTTNGSRTVKISGKEVMLKNKSYFKKSTGDEAATRSTPMGVLTHTITGKVYFTSWSMDVKVEGENVVRMADLTTHNHMSVPGNTPTWPYIDTANPAQLAACQEDMKREQEACGPHQKTKTLKSGKVVRDDAASKQAECASPECQKARKCKLTPYKPDQCCDGQSGHHLVEDHGFCEPRGVPLPQFSGIGYDINKAPVVCALSPNSNWEAEHGDCHAVQGVKENYAIMTASSRNPPRPPNYAWTYREAARAGVDAHAATFAGSGCSEACIQSQLDDYFQRQLGVGDDTPLRTTKYGFGTDPDQKARGVALIRELAEKRIGQITGSPFKLG